MTQTTAGSDPAAPNGERPQAVHLPLISVIVRTIGRASVQAALGSVAQQTYRPIEIVLVQARSDGVKTWPEVLQDVPLRVPDTSGQDLARAAAANFGLLHARGEFALFLDDDDELLPDHLNRLQRALASKPEAPAAFSDTDFGYTSGDGWHSLHRFEGGFDPIRLRFENFLPIHSVLFRLGAAALHIDEAFDLFEDWDFWLQMAQRGDFVHVPGISARYVAAEGQRSGVFVDSPATRQARCALFAKWQTASSPAAHAALIERLQQLYREHAQGMAELGAARDAQAHLQQLIAARSAELASMQDQAADLRHMLGERAKELGAFAEHVRSLGDLVKAREAESAGAIQHAQSLAEVLAARDAALIDAKRHTQALTDVIAAREHELVEAAQQAEALKALIAARDAALAESTRYALALKELLATREVSLAAAAGHAQALSDVVMARDTALADAARYAQGLTELAAAREKDWSAAAAYAADLRQHLDAAVAEAERSTEERRALMQVISTKDNELAELRTRLADLLAKPPLRAMVDAFKRRRTKPLRV